MYENLYELVSFLGVIVDASTEHQSQIQGTNQQPTDNFLVIFGIKFVHIHFRLHLMSLP